MKYFARITVEIEAESERDASNIAHNAALNCEEEPDVASASVDFTERAELPSRGVPQEDT